MPKVFIINDSGHDYSPAEKFGELITMSEGYVDKYSVTAMYRLFKPFIDSSQKEDIILQSGPIVMNNIACAMFAAKHGCLNLLIWRALPNETPRYVLRKLNLSKEKGNKNVKTN